MVSFERNEIVIVMMMMMISGEKQGRDPCYQTEAESHGSVCRAARPPHPGTEKCCKLEHPFAFHPEINFHFSRHICDFQLQVFRAFFFFFFFFFFGAALKKKKHPIKKIDK